MGMRTAGVPGRVIIGLIRHRLALAFRRRDDGSLPSHQISVGNIGLIHGVTCVSRSPAALESYWLLYDKAPCSRNGMAASCPSSACQPWSCTAQPTRCCTHRRAAHRRGNQRGPACRLLRVGHYLPAAVYPQVADEVLALADRAATATPPRPRRSLVRPGNRHGCRILTGWLWESCLAR